MEEIPANCVLSKGTTGCGATTLATEQRTPTIIAAPFVELTIIAAPFVELIGNKAAQYPDNDSGRPVLLPIYGEGDKTREIAEYMSRHGDLPKIMTTYDSVPKVCGILTSLGYDPYETMHLCIDEWHLLLNQYSFRNRAIRNLLETARDFDRVTYMSATPIERRYWLEELADMPEYRIY